MDTTLVTVLTSAGAAGVFCILFIIGAIYPRGVVEDLRAERDELRAQNAALQERVDAGTTAAQGIRDILAALQAGFSMGGGMHAGPPELREPGP